MPRTPSAWWDDRAHRYYVRLGPISEATGKRRSLMLRDEHGQPIARGNARAVAAAIQRRLAELDAERRAEADGITVGDLAARFLAWHEVAGSAPATIATHRRHLAAFCTFGWQGVKYGHRPAAEITPDDLARHEAAMRAAGNQSGYVRLRYASVLACWRWAHRPVIGRRPSRLLAGEDPFAGLARPRRGKITAKLLPWPEARRLLRFARGRAKLRRGRAGRGKVDYPAERGRVLALHFAAVTGCRPDEAARLRWDEVDWGSATATMRGKTTGRTGRERVIAIPPGMRRALAAWRPMASEEYVFMPAEGPKVLPLRGRDLAVWFRGLRADALAAGVAIDPKTTLYWLRHSWQSLGVATDTAERVAQAAGNSPGVLLSTYAHVLHKQIHETSEAVARARRRGGRGV